MLLVTCVYIYNVFVVALLFLYRILKTSFLNLGQQLQYAQNTLNYICSRTKFIFTIWLQKKKKKEKKFYSPLFLATVYREKKICLCYKFFSHCKLHSISPVPQYDKNLNLLNLRFRNTIRQMKTKEFFFLLLLFSLLLLRSLRTY